MQKGVDELKIRKNDCEEKKKLKRVEKKEEKLGGGGGRKKSCDEKKKKSHFLYVLKRNKVCVHSFTNIHDFPFKRKNQKRKGDQLSYHCKLHLPIQTRWGN